MTSTTTRKTRRKGGTTIGDLGALGLGGKIFLHSLMISFVVLVIPVVPLLRSCVSAASPASSSPSSSLNAPTTLQLVSPSTSTSTPTSSATSSRRIVAAIPGDLVVGALFPVHHAPVLKQAHTRQCTIIREQYGIQRIEASFLTIDSINSDDSILPNITLGLEIRDSCWYSPIALEQSIEFIRDAMAAGEEKAARAAAAAGGSLMSSSSLSHESTDHSYVPDPYLDPSSSFDPASSSSSSSVISGSPLLHMLKPMTHALNASSFMCPRGPGGKKVKNIVGVIGPASSSVTIQVQNLLQLFNIPQIGYSATSRDLSIKSYYKYFLRVVPSDLLQARVMVDLMKTYNWTYISAVYTDGNYGSSLMEVFKNLAQDEGICIANTETVFNNAEDDIFDSILDTLLKYKQTARVVACFCEGMTVRGLLKAIRRHRVEGRGDVTGELIFVGSDGWADRYDVIEGYEKEAVGGISVRIYSPYVHEFDDYYFSLHPENNTRNPWFREFWEHKFNCTLPPVDKNLNALNTSSSLPVSGSATSSRPRGMMPPPSNQGVWNPSVSLSTGKLLCTGREKLSEKYKQDTKMAFVMKSIWTMAYGLHNMQKDLCPNMSGLCPQMLPIDGSLFLQYLMNVTFKWGNETVSFDEHGDPPGKYDIMNLQETSANEVEYVHVGSWVSLANGDKEFNMFRSLQWSERSLTSLARIPESVCSRPCPKGQAKNIQSDSVKCCWVCVPCQRNQFLEDEYTCKDCPLGWWPKDDLTSGCYQIDIEYIQWTETPSLIAIGIAVGGIIVTIMVMTVFIQHNNTPVVKASTRELSYMIMFGMIMAHSTTFFLLAKPTMETCFVTRVLPGLSFAIIYASLVTKTNRIARILAGSKKRIMTKKLRFMSSFAQVVISLIIICIEIGIIAGMLVLEAADSKLDYPTLEQVKLVCNTTTYGIAAPLGFDFFLIIMCTVYAVKTRNVPENFNEAKFIGFTMYTTLVIWIAFIPIYFGSQLKVLTMCLSISFSAIVALVLLFFPKCYIILFKPEKNNRSYFTTAKNVRCHIGYVPTVGISRHSSHSVSDPEQTTAVSGTTTGTLTGKDSDFKIGPRSVSLEKKSSEKDKGTKASQRGSASDTSRKKSLNIFERLRLSKQDKIAEQKIQKIRAVRAAEDLDRRVNAKRSAGRGAYSTSSSIGQGQSSVSNQIQRTTIGGTTETRDETSTMGEAEAGQVAKMESVDDQADNNEIQRNILETRMRVINLLREKFGEEICKIREFLEFEASVKAEYLARKRIRKKTLVDSYTQTPFELIESLILQPGRLMQRIGQVEQPEKEDDTSAQMAQHAPLQQKLASAFSPRSQRSPAQVARVWDSHPRQAWIVSTTAASRMHETITTAGIPPPPPPPASSYLQRFPLRTYTEKEAEALHGMIPSGDTTSGRVVGDDSDQSSTLRLRKTPINHYPPAPATISSSVSGHPLPTVGTTATAAVHLRHQSLPSTQQQHYPGGRFSMTPADTVLDSSGESMNHRLSYLPPIQAPQQQTGNLYQQQQQQAVQQQLQHPQRQQQLQQQFARSRGGSRESVLTGRSGSSGGGLYIPSDEDDVLTGGDGGGGVKSYLRPHSSVSSSKGGLSVCEESASSDPDDSSPSTSSAGNVVYKNIIITLRPDEGGESSGGEGVGGGAMFAPPMEHHQYQQPQHPYQSHHHQHHHD